MTRESSLRGRRVSLVENVRVIVRQFFSNFHIPDGFDPDPAVLDHSITVRIARVIDEARIIPVDGRVDHDVIVNCEEIGVMSRAFVVGIPLVRLARSEPLAGVFNEPGSNRNRPYGKCTESLYR